MKRMRSRLTYSNVVSTLALFVAVGGASAYAAQQLGARSVGERELRPGAVTAEKLRKNAVTAPKIKALAVKKGKLANGAVTEAKLGDRAVSTSKLGSAAVIGEKIAPDVITGDKVDESTLSQVPSAKAADFATNAESANPEAFAAVAPEGNVDSSLSKGLTSADVVQKGANAYCITVPAFDPKGGQVTLKNAVSSQSTAYLTIGGSSECPAPKVKVQTWDSGVAAKEAFYIVLYR